MHYFSIKVRIQKLLESHPVFRTFVILCFFYFGALNNSSAQYYEIPFEIHNNLIIITLKVNFLSNEKFIFDTGSDNNIYFEKPLADFLGFEYSRTIKVFGSDVIRPIEGLIARQIDLETREGLKLKTDMVVLSENPFHMDEIMGFKVSGIIGNSMFRNKVIEVNFPKNKIYIYKDPIDYSTKHYKQLPTTWIGGKPYFYSDILFNPSDTVNKKLLLFDMGAAISVLMYDDQSFQKISKLIPGRLAMGLGGELSGHIGRVHSFQFDQHHFKDVITHFYELDSLSLVPDQSNKDGIVGNLILSMFNLIIDYPRQQIWYKPNKSIHHPPKLDRSGLVLIAYGKDLANIVVKDVLPKSPALEADIRPDDEILSINGIPVILRSLSEINKTLCHEHRKQLRLKIKRGQEIIRKTVFLRDLI